MGKTKRAIKMQNKTQHKILNLFFSLTRFLKVIKTFSTLSHDKAFLQFSNSCEYNESIKIKEMVKAIFFGMIDIKAGINY